MTDKDIQLLVKEFLPKKHLIVKAMAKKFLENGQEFCLVLTSSGVALGRLAGMEEDSVLDGLLQMEDACFQCNSGQTINIPTLFLFVDEIASFQPLDESNYQDLIAQLQKRK